MADILNKSIIIEKIKQSYEIIKSKNVSNFSGEIDFGTGGIRAIMGDNSDQLNAYNIYKVSLGLANFLNDNLDLIEKYNLEKSVVIAYDNRFNSELFCYCAAYTLASKGFKVYYYDSLRTTPQLSFSVRYLKCIAGIMITASHNPKEYNGYKVYNHFGGQLINSEARVVKKYIDKIENDFDLIANCDNKNIVKLDKSIDEEFYKCDLKVSNENDLSNLTIIYSPSHGTGLVPVSEVLRRKKVNLILVKESSFPSNSFENIKSPNPEEKESFELGIKYLKENKGDILLVSDPDCDRIGGCILDKNNNPYYINGNLMGLLIADYLLNKRQLNNKSTIVSTIVSSCLIKKMTSFYNVNYKEVFTGFKNIADVIINDDIDFLFGFEESYGYLINPYIRDKDAVQASLIIAEMTSFYKKQNITLLDKINEIYDKFGRVFDSQFNIKLEGNDKEIKKSNLMNKAYNFNLEYIGDYKIKNVYNHHLGIDKYNNPIIKGDNLVKIEFDDESFICIRPSGTEPKVKIYFSILGNKEKELFIKKAFIDYLNLNNGTILKLSGVLVNRIWGGSYFKDKLKMTESDDKIGELWSASGFKGYESKILNDGYENISFRDFYKEHRNLFCNIKDEEFPILVKLIATSDKLSVQVHPDDKYALENENSLGKKEGWLILDSTKDSKLVIGHKAKTHEELVNLVNNKDYDHLLNYLTPKKGEFYPIPSGTIHAIGKDIVLLEVQQSSNITYRFYDYDRVDANGNLRELHIKKALDVVNINKYDQKIINCFESDKAKLWDCEYFDVNYFKVDGLLNIKNNTFSVLSVIIGTIYINNIKYKVGESAVICSDAKNAIISGLGEVVLTTHKLKE